MTNQHTPWSGLLPIDDTALFVRDSGGAGIPVVYLNGAYADQGHWRRTIGELGGRDWRHITYDERARGRSKRSADYSFAACLRDLDAVLDATGVDRPLLAGWSYGATLAVHWAARNPGRALGVVAVDGAMPYDWIDDAARARLRTLFRRMRWLLPIAARLGMAARMSAEQHAEVNIEVNELLGGLGPVLDAVACPSGTSTPRAATSATTTRDGGARHARPGAGPQPEHPGRRDGGQQPLRGAAPGLPGGRGRRPRGAGGRPAGRAQVSAG
ncbi:MAG: alpha/beta hydrolase [Micropruina sp.]